MNHAFDILKSHCHTQGHLGLLLEKAFSRGFMVLRFATRSIIHFKLIL